MPQIENKENKNQRPHISGNNGKNSNKPKGSKILYVVYAVIILALGGGVIYQTVKRRERERVEAGVGAAMAEQNAFIDMMNEMNDEED